MRRAPAGLRRAGGVRPRDAALGALAGLTLAAALAQPGVAQEPGPWRALAGPGWGQGGGTTSPIDSTMGGGAGLWLIQAVPGGNAPPAGDAPAQTRTGAAQDGGTPGGGSADTGAADAGARPADDPLGAAQDQGDRIGPSAAEQPAAPRPPAPPPVLTVDQEALYTRSAWGRRAQVRLAEVTRQVTADNDRIFAELSAAEDELTTLRATLPPDEFRRRATAFDERVTQVRRERDAAARGVAQAAEEERARFFDAAAPILHRMMRERGAQVVLDQRIVLFFEPGIDVTAEVVARLDGTLGDGATGADPGDAAAPPAPAPGAVSGAGAVSDGAVTPPAAPLTQP